MEQIKEWFEGLDQNEKKIVIVAAIFFSVALIFFAIIKPLNDSVSSLQSQVNGRQNSVAQWKENMPVLVANRGASKASTSNRSLSNLVTSTTRRYKLNVSRVQEKNANEMQVWFDNVPFDSFLRWVAELENRHQIRIDSVNIRSKDRDGLISTDIKLVRG